MPKENAMDRTTPLLLAVLLGVAGTAHAADAASTKPAAMTAKAAKPSARGPGTQTEDDLYVGAKAKTPSAAKAQKPKGVKTGDEDLDDLEIQRAGMAKRR
jgi:hypothetical protein